MAIEVERQVLPLFELEDRSRWYNPDLPETDPFVPGPPHLPVSGRRPSTGYT